MNRSKQAVMAIKTMIALLVGVALAFVHLADAQQAGKRIGYLVYRFNEIYLITRTELQTFSNDALLAPR